MIYHNTVCSFHDPYAILFLWEHMNVRFRSRLFPSLESYELEYWRFEAILFYVTSVWWLTKELDDLKYLCFSSLYSIITCLFWIIQLFSTILRKWRLSKKKTDTNCLFFRNPLTLILTVIGKFLAPIFLVVYIWRIAYSYDWTMIDLFYW